MISKLKQNIPNALTLGNVLCGCLGIQQSYTGALTTASAFILLGAFFDFFDGFAARLLKVSSPLGKQLDSLADMITFGVLPGVICYQLLAKASLLFWVPHMAWILPLAAAWRLAKFNIDTNQTDQFLGVPTPAVALFLGSLPFIAQQPDSLWAAWVAKPEALLACAFILSGLMVSNIPLLALKFKSFQWEGNQLRYVLLATAPWFIVLMQVAGIPVLIFWYILLSFTGNILKLQ